MVSACVLPLVVLRKATLVDVLDGVEDLKRRKARAIGYVPEQEMINGQ